MLLASVFGERRECIAARAAARCSAHISTGRSGFVDGMWAIWLDSRDSKSNDDASPRDKKINERWGISD
jgi:hypothetical protein